MLFLSFPLHNFAGKSVLIATRIWAPEGAVASLLGRIREQINYLENEGGEEGWLTDTSTQKYNYFIVAGSHFENVLHRVWVQFWIRISVGQCFTSFRAARLERICLKAGLCITPDNGHSNDPWMASYFKFSKIIITNMESDDFFSLSLIHSGITSMRNNTWICYLLCIAVISY